MRILPFLFDTDTAIGANIELVWETHLDLREIARILFSRSVPSGAVPYLAVCITNCLHNFTVAFPDVTMAPKMHYLVHCPRYLQLLCPLTGVWTMRYKSNHYHLKQLPQRIPNCPNVSTSLAKQHQLMQCYTFSSSACVQENTETTGSSKIWDCDLPSNVHSVMADVTTDTGPMLGLKMAYTGCYASPTCFVSKCCFK